MRHRKFRRIKAKGGLQRYIEGIGKMTVALLLPHFAMEKQTHLALQSLQYHRNCDRPVKAAE